MTPHDPQLPVGYIVVRVHNTYLRIIGYLETSEKRADSHWEMSMLDSGGFGIHDTNSRLCYENRIN